VRRQFNYTQAIHVNGTFSTESVFVGRAAAAIAFAAIATVTSRIFFFGLNINSNFAVALVVY
jgi:hypothetical protein